MSTQHLQKSGLILTISQAKVAFLAGGKRELFSENLLVSLIFLLTQGVFWAESGDFRSILIIKLRQSSHQFLETVRLPLQLFEMVAEILLIFGSAVPGVNQHHHTVVFFVSLYSPSGLVDLNESLICVPLLILHIFSGGLVLVGHFFLKLLLGLQLEVLYVAEGNPNNQDQTS